MEQLIARIQDQYAVDVYFPDVRLTDIVEILILTVLLYHLIIWVKNTKAWMLMKGIAVLAVFIL
ncbi:MAG: TIGR00159 family protein, partial [Dorea sp.]